MTDIIIIHVCPANHDLAVDNVRKTSQNTDWKLRAFLIYFEGSKAKLVRSNYCVETTALRGG